MFADLFNGFIHGSNFALNYKEEKHLLNHLPMSQNISALWR